MNLTADECQLLLNLLSHKTIIEPSSEFPFVISRKEFGYSKDEKIGKLQAKLSIWKDFISKS